MKIFCSASRDTYITDKIIDSSLRATDANVGRAGTLDLFKLYNETELLGTGSQSEISRLLVKFDLSKARSLLGNKLDIDKPGFSAKIRMFDISTGNSTPSNYTVIAHPLSMSFDEGIERNVSSFSDLDVCNFITASVVNGSAIPWFKSGASDEGSVNSEGTDIIGSGTLDGNNVFFYGTQYFKEGNEDLVVDVTRAVSGTLAGYIPDFGFRIAFSGSDETDQKSRFVKRFGTRHSSNPLIRPRLEISFDDSIQDNRSNFFFDSTGTIFLENSLRSSLSNLKKGGQELTGQDCVSVKLVKGSYSKTFFGSQHTGSGDSGETGVYSASFAIDSEDSTEYARGKTLSSLISRDKKVIFDEYWFSNDATKGFHTGSLTVYAEVPSTSLLVDTIDIYSLNCKNQYNRKDEERIHVFAVNHSNNSKKPTKIKTKKKSEIFEKLYYRVLDADSHSIIFDFGEDDNSTRVSTGIDGMFFDFHFDVLPPGRAYVFEYLAIEKNSRKTFRDRRSRFTVR